MIAEVIKRAAGASPRKGATIFMLLCAVQLLQPWHGGRAQQLPLRAAMSRALERNATLRSVDAQHRVAEAGLRETRSGHLPRITASTSYTWYQEANIIFPIHQAGVFPPLDDRIFDSNVQLTLPLWSGGRTSGRVDMAEAAMAESAAQSRRTRQEVLEQLAGLYIKSAELNDKQQLLRERRTVLAKRRQDISALLDEGRSTQAQRSLIDAEMAAVAADSMSLQLREQEIAWQLGQLTGAREAVAPYVGDLQLERALAAARVDSAAIPRAEKNADFMAAQARLQQREAMEALAWKSFLPDFNAFALYNYRSGATNWDPAGEWAAGLRLSIPLFDGGRRIAGLRGAKEQTQAAEYHLQAVELQFHAQARVAGERWQVNLRQREMADEAVQRKMEFLRAQEQLHAAGRLTIAELMTQENELLQLRMQERTYLYGMLTAVLRWHALHGSLTQERIETLLGEQEE
ncbi:MAG: TolC family protein [Bacteroidota bacterium]|nr:TolC family protein [Bacteroidota bacterium]